MSSPDKPLARLDLAMDGESSTVDELGQYLDSTTLGSRRFYMEEVLFGSQPSFYEVEKNRGTVLVGMDVKGDITALEGEEQRIATFGLGGCTAVAIAAELPDGSRKGYIQHYSPLNRRLSADILADATSRFVTEGAMSTRVVVMTPGEWTLDPADKWGMKPKDDVLTGLLTATARARLGVDTDVQVYPYSEMQESGRYGQGTLMVELTRDEAPTIYAEMMIIPEDK